MVTEPSLDPPQLHLQSLQAIDSAHHDCCAHHHEHHDLVIDQLSVSYRQIVALDHISLNTSCGNRVALIGPNGAGKSTLLKAIAGLVPKSTGSISWRGTQIRKWSREFAYLPQREAVDWDFPITVRGLVEMGRYPQLGMFKKFRKEDEDAVDGAIETLGLEDLQERQISQLSGGQQQRAFIARAVAQDAHVLLLDEPFTGLDRPSSETLGQLLATLAQEGRLVIASHHDINTLDSLFNQALLVNCKSHGFGDCQSLITESSLAETFSQNQA
ncbi:metal ABC transporter ATP-binding protein [Rubritalea marina]|uniref:metal ABC transporter ATP-binding protein n=1 Tax=Rubritalea marina TaxID=361055 RepID=UPI00037501B4|nr:ABC transporter ATP-binding protein [Rubritalea marina]